MNRPRTLVLAVALIAVLLPAPALAAETVTHANPARIDINRSPNWFERVGPAEPYPSTISVEGRVGTVTKVTVQLVGYSHSWPSDVDMQLVGPQGQRTILMSDAGGRCDTFDYTLTLDDDAPTALPGECPFGHGPIVPGTYRPANHDDGYGHATLEGPYPATLSVFNGTNPNGVWSLYVFDDWPHDDGEFAGGWSLTITTADVTPPTLHTPVSVEADATSPLGTEVSFAVTATDEVDPAPTVACTPASGSTFPIGMTTVTCTATDDAGNSASASFVVVVLGADDQLEDLQETVTGYDLQPAGVATSFLVKLQAALDALAVGDTAAACAALQDFLAHVGAQRGKKLTEAQADELTAHATRIRTVLAC